MMALSDIKVKQEQMRKNRDFLASKYALPLDSSLQYLVGKEINLGLQDLDGSNNAKKLQKSDKGTWKWTYFSVMRLTYSLRPMFVFMEIFFRTLVTEKEKSFRQALSFTYSETFGT